MAIEWINPCCDLSSPVTLDAVLFSHSGNTVSERKQPAMRFSECKNRETVRPARTLLDYEIYPLQVILMSGVGDTRYTEAIIPRVVEVVTGVPPI